MVTGVTGSALGRYVLSSYIPWLSARVVKRQKNEDLEFVGQQLAAKAWRMHLFVLLYTLMPLPSTPLFTAVGMARIKAIRIIPAFFVGKFTSDMVMVLTGNYVANNMASIAEGFLTWKSILGTLIGILIICCFLFIDWRTLLREKKFRLSFNIWR